MDDEDLGMLVALGIIGAIGIGTGVVTYKLLKKYGGYQSGTTITANEARSLPSPSDQPHYSTPEPDPGEFGGECIGYSNGCDCSRCYDPGDD